MRTAEPSTALRQMTAALRHDPALDVQLVPVTVLWGRSPGSQDDLLKALFADAWASVGPLRQLAIIAMHGRQTHVSFGGARIAAPADRRRKRRRDGGAQGQPLPALPLSPDARIGDRARSVAPAQPDPLDGGVGGLAAGDRRGVRAGSVFRLRRPRTRRGVSHGRSRPTSATPSYAPGSCFSRASGASCTTGSRSSMPPRSSKWRRARGSSICPITAVTSTTCSCPTSSRRRALRRRTSRPARTSTFRSSARSCGVAARSSCAGASRASRSMPPCFASTCTR